MSISVSENGRQAQWAPCISDTSRFLSAEQRKLRERDKAKGVFSLQIEEFVEESERKKVVDPFLVLSVRLYNKAEVRLYVDYWNETEFVPVYREV